MNNTLIKGLQILEVLARATRPLGVSELAGVAGLGKSAIHRLLQGLVEQGFAQKDDDKGVYWATLKVWELGEAVLSRLDLRRIAEPTLYALREQIRETIHLAVPEGGEVVYVTRLDSPQPIRLSSAVGRRAPAYCVSTGKAILAFTAPAWQEGISRTLVAQTPHTIVDPRKFLDEMAGIRERGYSVSREEWTLGVWGVGAPIRSGNGHVFGAISATGPMERMQETGIEKIAALLMAGASTIAHQLGAHPGIAPTPTL